MDSDVKKVQLGTLISEILYKTLKRISKETGTSMNFILEKAAWNYINDEYSGKYIQANRDSPSDTA